MPPIGRRQLYGVDSLGRRFRTDGGVRKKATHTDTVSKPLPPHGNPVKSKKAYKQSMSPFQQNLANNYEAWAKEGYGPARTAVMLRRLMSGKFLNWFLSPSKTHSQAENKEYVGRVIVSALAGGEHLLGGQQPLINRYRNDGNFDAQAFYDDHKDSWSSPKEVESYRNAL